MRFWWFNLKRDTAVVVVVIAGVCTCLVSGTMYAVSLWLPVMKEQLLWSQTEANMIAALGSLGQYLGFVSGLLNDLTSSRITLFVGGVVAACAYGGLALGATLNSCPALVAAVLMFCVGWGQFASFTAAYSPSAINVSPEKRSRTMGAMLVGFAASSLLCSLVFRLFSTVQGFLLLMACSILSVTLISAMIVRILPKEEENTVHSVELPALSTEDSEKTAETTGDSEIEAAELVAEKRVEEDPHPEQRPDVSPLVCLRRLDFWLLMLILALINGPGLFWITIQGSAARSLLLESSANLVALLACASVAGRLVVAFLSDALAKRLARSWLIIPCAVLMSFSLCLFALVQTQPLLYVTSSLVGAAYGMTYVLITTVTSLWFGTKFFATNNGIMGIGTAIIMFGLGLLNGFIYGSHADAQNRCFGPACFMATCLVASASAFCAIPVIAFVSWKFGQ